MTAAPTSIEGLIAEFEIEFGHFLPKQRHHSSQVDWKDAEWLREWLRTALTRLQEESERRGYERARREAPPGSHGY